jgi:hypothetical protein
MQSIKQHKMSAGLRGFAGAALATALTASFSWSFVVSADSLQWLSHGALDPPAVAMATEAPVAGRPG